MLLCFVECGCWSDEEARGWAGFLGGGVDDEDDEPTIVGLYCPACAALEFGFRPAEADTYT